MLLPLLSLLLCISTANARTWFDSDLYTVKSCNFAVLKQATFCESDDWKHCACVNQPAMASLLQCLYNEDNPDQYLTVFANKCNQVGVNITTAALYASYSNATDHFVDLDTTVFNSTEMSFLPVKNGNISHYYTCFYKGFEVRFTNKDLSERLGMGFLGMWALLVLLSTITNWTRRFFPKTLLFCNGKISRTFRKNFVLPPLFRKSHLEATAFGLIPTRFESLVLVANILYVVLATSIGFCHYGEDAMYSKKAAIARYVGDRSGVITGYMAPLVFLFSGRNNFLQWLTGWSFSSFVTYHKWLARLFVAEVIVHSGAMSIFSMAFNQWGYRLSRQNYRFGIVASVCCGFIVLFSFYRLRKLSYEIFLVLHILLAAACLAASWLHVKILLFGEFFYACTAIWCLDTLIRIARVSYYGIQTAHIELVESGVLKITAPRPARWAPYPGAHGFVHFLTPSLFWQSHPFTFVESESGNIHFYIKVKNGATKALARRIIRSGEESVRLPITVDGPYGECSPYHNYSKSVLVAAGNGIPGPFSHVMRLSRKKIPVSFYWSVREYHSLCWFWEELQLLRNTNAKVVIYITNRESKWYIPNSSDSSLSSKEKDTSSFSTKERDIETVSSDPLESLSFVEFRTGRMDLEEVLKAEVASAEKSMAIGICANPAMVDLARVTCADLVGKISSKRIDYFEELQSW